MLREMFTTHAYIFDREGKQIGKHRKVHLFDIDVKGGQTFKESDTLTAGDSDTVFDTEFGKIGVMLCFDIRFPELSRMMVNDGARSYFCSGCIQYDNRTGTLGIVFQNSEHWIIRFIWLVVLRHVMYRQDIFPGDIP